MMPLRCWLSVLLAGLAGCAVPSAGAPPPASGAHAASAPPPALGLDGLYVGRRTQVGGAPGCAEVGSVKFHVAGAHVWLHSRHKHRELDGSLSADGQLSLQDPYGAHMVTGLIVAGQLTATETVAPGGKHVAPAGPAADVCTLRIEAVHTTAGVSAQEP